MSLVLLLVLVLWLPLTLQFGRDGIGIDDEGDDTSRSSDRMHCVITTSFLLLLSWWLVLFGGRLRMECSAEWAELSDGKTEVGEMKAAGSLEGGSAGVSKWCTP